MSATHAPPARWRRFVWPTVVVGLLAGHVFIVTGALLLSATWIPGASIAPAGYADALRWDELRALRRASERLGWSLQVTPTERTELNGDRHVEFVLRDAAGEPLDDASLAVTLYHHSRPGDPIELAFEPAAGRPARYDAALRLRREGLWRIVATASRGDERFLVETDLWVRPAPGASS